MYKTLSEKEKEYYLNLAKDLLKGTFTECRDCSIYNGTGYFISSYKDVNKLDEVAEKIYKIIEKNKEIWDKNDLI